jgi:hypothetical protein
MGTKKTSKKSKTTKKSPKKSLSAERRQSTTELKPNELTVKFDHPSQILPKLLELAQQLSEDPHNLLIQPATTVEVDVLGAARARLIVSACAQSTAWGATLGELGLDPLIFRDCVSERVDQAGYVPPPIPATSATRLIDVVAAIQGAPRK